MIPAATSAKAIAVKALRDALGGLSVSTQMPKSVAPAARLPENFVILSRIGGGDGPFGTTAPRFLVECYGTSELDAENFAEKVRRAWLNLRTHNINWSYDDGNLTDYGEDQTPDRHRCQFTGGLQIIL